MATSTIQPDTKKMDYKKLLFSTNDSWGLFAIRLALAIAIFPHGAQKLLGWFGGYGFTGTMGFFTETMGIPYIFALLAVIAEFFGPLALVAGFLTRIAAFGVGFTMLVAMLMNHVQHGFFMNWFGNQAGEGIEYFILAIGISVALMIAGGGAASADKKLLNK